jgi:[ribosomal protein S18]-alanine N-acetyltransferase
VRIRRATAADIPLMVELERENPTSVNWSHEHYKSLFRTTAPELSRYFVQVAEDPSESKSLTVSATASPIVGYLAAHCVDSDWELQYVVVAKQFRRRGVGTSLVNEFICHVRATGGSRIFLEVRESNQSARRLYNTLGFEEAGLRKSYYANPPEDAILCRLRLY